MQCQSKLSGEPRKGTVRGANEVTAELRPTADEHNLLIGLKDEETLKRLWRSKVRKKVVEEVPISSNDSSSEFNDLFYVEYSTSSKGDIRSLRGRPIPML